MLLTLRAIIVLITVLIAVESNAGTVRTYYIAAEETL